MRFHQSLTSAFPPVSDSATKECNPVAKNHCNEKPSAVTRKELHTTSKKKYI